MPNNDKPATLPALDLNDVQGEIMNAYDHAVGVHLFLHFPDAAGARALIGVLAPQIATAAQWNSGASCSMNIGFTVEGLAALDLENEELQSFPYVFRTGMARRATLLGDTGESAPEHWDAPWRQPERVHCWLMIQADDESKLDSRQQSILSLTREYGAVVLPDTQHTANFTGKHAGAKEHFGFHDGIGEPAVQGTPGPVYPGQGTPVRASAEHPDGWAGIKLGSFLLGYENESGYVLPFPSNPELQRNGTFMAFRKLEQHPARFRNYIKDNKHLLDGDGELLAAKMVGRWRSGAPLELSPDRDDPELAKDPEKNNDFRYVDDPEGLRVPHLAHIRRMNPRDGLPKDAVVKPSRHRIIRRSMPYGRWLKKGESDSPGRGLIFRVFNADLVSQFELVQSQWVASGNIGGGLSTDQDPIAGETEPTSTGDARLQSTLPIPRPKGIVTLYGLPRFVTLKGGAYFFVPGINALKWLARPMPKAPGGAT